MESVDIFTGISNAFNAGGIWMYAILGVQIFTVAIVLERVYALYLNRGKSQTKIANQFEQDIKTGKLDRALGRVRTMVSQPIASVIHAGILAAQDMGGREEIHAKMDEVAAVENSKLDRRIGMLSMLGNVATLLGLLGTITGMIQSFGAIGTSGNVEKAQLLAHGISEAMNCTAYGLIVAIPSLVMYAVLTNRSHRLEEDFTNAATKVFNWLSFSYEPVKPNRQRLS